MRQSIPAGYLNVEVSGSFDIDVYIDLNGQWVSGNRGNKINWDFKMIGFGQSKGDRGIKTWSVKRETEQLLTEWNDRSEWGTMHFSGPADVRHESGISAILRQRFARTGMLQNRNDDGFRGIMEEEPVFAFSKHFSLNSTSSPGSATSASVLFTIAHCQDPIVQFASARGLTFMRPLWASWFESVNSLLMFHYMDFPMANRLARNYSDQLAEDALKSGSDNYRDIVALSARQVLGATSFSGTPDNPILFLKEISSNGNFQTVDVIFPSFPFFLYTNPRWLAYLLEPLIEHMLSGQYPNDYSMHDLGTHFPNATGHPDGYDEYMPVEECGNMLIMGLALVNSLRYDSDSASLWSQLGSSNWDSEAKSAFPLTNLEFRNGVFGLDDSWGGPIGAKGEKQAKKWVQRSYRLWKQWTGYLVRESLIPHNQRKHCNFVMASM
jgi:hypothetical protein